MKKKYFTEEERQTAKKKWNKKYREFHKKELKERYENNKNYFSERYQKNKDTIIEQHKEYYQNNKEKIKQYHKDYRKTHKKQRNNYTNNKIKNDINFKLKIRLRIRLYGAIKNNWKVGSAVKDLGCSISELKTYLESKFQEGMTWKNWSKTGWHIDHITPLDSFNLQNREEFLKACHYTNLQPMWAEENLKKNKNHEHFQKNNC
jgi:hypothetical protein